MKAVAPVAVAPLIQPRVESSADIKALTELVARQSAAIEALTKRLDASDASPKAAPVAAVVTPGAPAATPAAPAASAAPAAHKIAPRPPSVSESAVVPRSFSRWGDMQSPLTLGLRYRYIDTSGGVRTNNQGQNRTEFKGRFKFDLAQVTTP